ncbi:dehydrogenase/reductase SDR family member on chromosome X [Notolabrus celidotus]|uniref:dehydrogenase/reductase SDR family member on chromosome X n=1 Tax=Notolabrus celidotus TaxID=1203425 RepID=UPI001490865C|nr:dehydrogenase/reductase SDR family member on chromosome X [Notolabrus celidotus]XP_034533979.1 dehydrogenase/reductase SDR family member on chromosome X [Notolabrus celidotus]
MWLLSVLVPLVRLYFCGAKVLFYQMFYRSFKLPVLPKQCGRVAIVTGGTRGMGFEAARHLAGLGMHVFIVGNEKEEGTKAVQKIQEDGAEGKAEFVFVDLTSLKSVRQFAQTFRDRGLPLHLLVNNAGTMLVPERQTEDGFEFHFGLNYLGHFLLTNLLLDILKESGKPGRCSRIVNMSSATHYAGIMNMDDLNRRKHYSSHGAYAQSKLALVLFTYYLQEQMMAGGYHVTANAVDPGMVDTALYDNLWTLAQMLKKPVAKILFRTPAEGASIALLAAASSEFEGVGACYLYNGEKRSSAEVSYDTELQAKLWKRSSELVALQKA